MPLGRSTARSTIELGLRDDPLRAVRSVLDRALALIGDLAGAREGGAALAAEVTACRHLIETHAPVAEIEAACLQCLSDCGEFLAGPVGDEAAGAETNELVAMVREAMQQVSHDGQQVGAGMTDAVTRFDAVLKLTDLKAVKASLAAEVAHFRDTLTARQRAFDATMARYRTDIEGLEHRLARQDDSAMDALTGLPNRGAFDRTARGLADLPGSRFALVVIDIDGLRRINGEHGNLAGDRTLLGLAQALKAAVRDVDLVARYGGDEFVVLMRETTPRQAEAAIANAVAAFSHARMTADDGRAVVAHLSGGIVEFVGGEPLAEAFARATAAVAAAKKQGGNRLLSRAAPLQAVGAAGGRLPH